MLLPSDEDASDSPMAIRRHHDRCFHVAEEVTPEGYIVDGVLIAHDEVAQALPLTAALAGEAGASGGRLACVGRLAAGRDGLAGPGHEAKVDGD